MALVAGYKQNKQNRTDVDLDLSRYESIDATTKESVQHLFGHLMSVVEGNFLSTKTEALALATQKKESESVQVKMKEEVELSDRVHEEELKALEEERDSDIAQLIQEHKIAMIEMEEKLKLSNKENKAIKSENSSLIKRVGELERELKISDKLMSFSKQQDNSILVLKTQIIEKDKKIEELDRENRENSIEVAVLKRELEIVKANNKKTPFLFAPVPKKP